MALKSVDATVNPMEIISSLELGRPIGLFAPHQILVDAFCNVRTIHIYKQSGLQNWTHNNETVKQFQFMGDPETSARLSFVLDRLRSSEPIFSRHYENLANLEKAYREIAVTVLSLANDLERNNIAVVVFPTMSSHHIDSLIMEIACQVNQIPQVFQYIPVVANRCIPIVQKMKIEDRRLLSNLYNAQFSPSWSPTVNLDNFRAPSIGSTLEGKSSYNQAILSILVYAIRTTVRKFRKTYWKNILGFRNSESLRISRELTRSRNIQSSLKPISFLQDIKLINIHKKSLKLLDRFVDNDFTYIKQLLQNDQAPANPLIAIAANYQPEATTFPEAGDIYNFIELVIYMRSLGIVGPILYKEHPATRFFAVGHRSTRCGVARSVYYYSALKSMGVYFLDSGFDLSTTESVIPLTLNGSIAIERSLRGLPTIVTGSPWFEGMPGTFSLTNLINSPTKFRLIKSEGTAYSASEFINDIMKFSITIEPILYGIKISDQKKIEIFIKEYQDFLLSLQELEL